MKGGYRRGKNLTWTGTWVRNFVDLSVGDFTTDLVGLRFNWSFTPKSFLQTFSQYNNITQQIGHNVRLGLLSTSSTGFFLVYNTTGMTRDFFDPTIFSAERCLVLCFSSSTICWIINYSGDGVARASRLAANRFIGSSARICNRKWAIQTRPDDSGRGKPGGSPRRAIRTEEFGDCFGRGAVAGDCPRRSCGDYQPYSPHNTR